MKLFLGTRGSQLALWQANWIKARLSALHPTVEVELRIVKTSGDRITGSLAKAGGKGLFIKEIEEALVVGNIDLAVHSMKDVPAMLADGLCIAAIPEREDPRDALVSRDRVVFSDLGPGARVGTGSLRRSCQLKQRRPELELVPLRGNVDTRLRKMRSGEVDAVVLALAGLKRLGLDGEVANVLSAKDCLPAVGQGALAIETRSGDDRVLPLIEGLHDQRAATCVTGERAFLLGLGGDCNVPVAAHARLVDGRVSIDGMVGRPDGTQVLREHVEGDASSPEALGKELADALLARGAGEILEEIRTNPT